MAENAIQSYTGDYLALVGETSGDTATQAFEKILRASWNMVEKVELPNFFNTCYHLTIWKREPNKSWPLVCATCGSLPKDVILRCRQTRAVMACDRKCATDPKCKEIREKEMDQRFIPFKNLPFDK